VIRLQRTDPFCVEGSISDNGDVFPMSLAPYRSSLASGRDFELDDVQPSFSRLGDGSCSKLVCEDVLPRGRFCMRSRKEEPELDAMDDPDEDDAGDVLDDDGPPLEFESRYGVEQGDGRNELAGGFPGIRDLGRFGGRGGGGGTSRASLVPERVYEMLPNDRCGLTTREVADLSILLSGPRS